MLVVGAGGRRGGSPNPILQRREGNPRPLSGFFPPLGSEAGGPPGSLEGGEGDLAT